MDLIFAQVLFLLFLLIQPCSCYLFSCDPYERKLCPELTHRCDGCRICWMQTDQLDVGCGSGNFTNLPNNIFSSIKLTQGLTGINIYLVSSGITSIDDGAFHGIESQVKSLDLQYNKLAVVPPALGKLHNLKILLLVGNPIQTVADSVISGFGASITKFTISLDHMSSYPTALNQLKAVEKMELYDIPFDIKDLSTFRGQIHLNYLLLKYPTNFQGHIIPPGVLNLSGLTYLSLYGRYPNCDCSLSYLKTWNVTGVQISPSCYGQPQRIPEFISGPLQHCS